MTDDAKPSRSSRWRAGQSGNPRGKPTGARNKILAALDAIGAESAEAVLRQAVAAAESGDLRAAELILGRVWPAGKGRPVALTLPVLNTPADLPAAMAAIIGAVAAGDITPDEGLAVSQLLEAHRRAIETVELEQRISALEKKDGSAH